MPQHASASHAAGPVDPPLAPGPAPDGDLQGRVLPVLGGYRLLRQIGQGRRATAWLAHDEARDAPAVLKVATRRGGTDDAAAAFACEYARIAGLRHPNVVHLLEHGAAGGVAWLAMEYIDGGDLAQRLRAPVDPAHALALLRDAASGLAQLHARRLVHRDVKPANLLLRAAGAAVLADFGLAAPAGSVSRAAHAGAIVGTPRYVAPEQLEGGPAAPSADIYSLGVVFHEMLAGAPPFGGVTLMEVLSQQLVALPPRLPAACAALQPLCDAMLAKQPGERPADAQDLLLRIAGLPSGPSPFPVPSRSIRHEVVS